MIPPGLNDYPNHNYGNPSDEVDRNDENFIDILAEVPDSVLEIY
jgi:hypothetical protein